MHDEGAIEANLETLLRCTQVDDCLVLCLWSGNVINEATKSRLEAEPSMHHRCLYLYEWLQQQQSQSDAYLQFLRIMDNNDQRHVTNLLRNSLEGADVPLSLDRCVRLRRLAPDLLFLIYVDEELVSVLQATRALTAFDCEELRMDDRTQCKRNALLVNAVLRRSDHSFDRLREALVRTRQEHIAHALVQGQIVRVHLETSRSELDVELSRAMNSRKQLGCLLDGLHSQGIHFVRCRPDHSILVYFYCKTPQQMIQFTKQFDSDELALTMTDVLNSLLKAIRPKEKRHLEVNLRLEDEDVTRVRDFTGLENWTGVQPSRSASDRQQKPRFPALLDPATQRTEASEVTGTEKKDRKTRAQTPKRSLPSKSSANEASADFEFLTADIECLRLEAKVHQLEAELKRRETEWTTERQKLNDKIKEAQEKQESQHLQLKNIFDNDLLNRLNSSRNKGKCRDESEKQTEFHRTV